MEGLVVVAPVPGGHVICAICATIVYRAISHGPARTARCVMSVNSVDGVGYGISGTIVYMGEVHAVS